MSNKITATQSQQSSRPGESPPQALTVPGVSLSTHPAPHVPYSVRFVLLEGSSHLWLTDK